MILPLHRMDGVGAVASSEGTPALRYIQLSHKHALTVWDRVVGVLEPGTLSCCQAVALAELLCREPEVS